MKEQISRKRLEKSKATREFDYKKQIARKELQNKQQLARKRQRNAK